MRQISQTAAFTLIELMVVIAIISTIATGLIIAIDPIEKVNQSSDRTTQSFIRDITLAFGRYAAVRQYSAACPDSSCATYNDSLSTTTPVLASALSTTNSILNAAGEAKSSTLYTSNSAAGRVWTSITNTTQPIMATFVLCWQPRSKSEKTRANILDPTTPVYNNLGVLQTAVACPATSANACYICARQ